jgi:hypothetical protein
MIARLKKGVTLAQAQERIDDLNRRNLDIFPQLKSLIINARFGTRVVGLKDEMVRARAVQPGGSCSCSMPRPMS